jgi:hypothetical protein
VGC